MGALRNGARTYLNVLRTACRLSHLPGFQAGVRAIIGDADATAIFALWDPLCVFVEALVSRDNFFNQIDTVEETEGSEDVVLA